MERNQTNPSVYFEDSSLIYVRDRHGTLHPPPGYEGRNIKRSTSPSQVPVDPYLKVVHGATCTVTTTLTQQSPCKLYEICKNFVAKNLHLVESLIDFPEAVGYDIFQEAILTKTFLNNPEYVYLFCVAYKNVVLEHLNLRRSTLVINENIHIFQCFNNLTKLDLAHCRLGDKHEYLQLIGKMKSLRCICLKDNCLTDSGISSWTLPHRMLKSGPELLRTLDLSCNPEITDFCAKYLVKFLHLKSLNLSATSITLTSGVHRIMKLTNLKLVSFIPVFSKEVFTKTKGWASPLIWGLSSTSTNTKPIRPKSDNQPKNRFYKPVGSLAQSAVKVNNECKINCDIYPTILLQSEELVLPDTLRNIENNSLEKQDKKRMHVDNGVILHSSCKKRKLTTLKCIKNDNDELQMSGVELDDGSCNLIESYLKYL